MGRKRPRMGHAALAGVVFGVVAVAVMCCGCSALSGNLPPPSGVGRGLATSHDSFLPSSSPAGPHPNAENAFGLKTQLQLKQQEQRQPQHEEQQAGSGTAKKEEYPDWVAGSVHSQTPPRPSLPPSPPRHSSQTRDQDREALRTDLAAGRPLRSHTVTTTTSSAFPRRASKVNGVSTFPRRRISSRSLQASNVSPVVVGVDGVRIPDKLAAFFVEWAYPEVLPAFGYHDVEEAIHLLVANDSAVDMVVMDYFLSDQDISDHPRLLQIPFTATPVLACFNIPGFPDEQMLVLDTNAIVGILSGTIQYWDDPALLALNPDLTALLPHERLHLIARKDSGALAAMLRFASIAQPMFNVTAALANFELARRDTEATQRHVTIPYSLLVTSGWHSREFRFREAAMVNRAGNVVLPTFQSVSFALMEYGGSFDEHLRVDLLHPLSTYAWPFSIYISTTILLDDPVHSCERRIAIQTFVHDIQDIVVSSSKPALELLGVVAPPDFVLQLFVETMDSNFRCRGELLVPVEPRTTFVAIGSTLPANYGLDLKAISSSFIEDGNGALIGRGEHLSPTRLSYLSLPNVDSLFSTLPMSLTGYEQAPGYMEVPITFASVGLIYRLDALVNSTGLVLDFKALADIFTGSITHWNDPVIASLNSGLASLLPNATIRVVAQAGFSEVTSLFTGILATRVPRFASIVTPGPVNNFPSGFTQLEETEHIVPFVDENDGSLSFSAGFLARHLWPNIRVAKLLHGGVETSGLNSHDLEPCADGTFVESKGLFDLSRAPPDCYPLSTVLTLIFPHSMNGLECATARLPAQAAMTFLDYSVDHQPTSMYTSVGLGHFPDDIVVNNLRPALRDLQCGGTPMAYSYTACKAGETRISDSQCISCSVGTYTLTAGGPCLPCPSGALCHGGSHIAAKKNHWQGSNLKFYACDEELICCPDGACVKNSSMPVCASERRQDSLLCGECSGDMIMWLGECTKCDGVNWILLSVVILISVGGNMLLLRMRSTSFAFFKLFTDFVQIASVVTGDSRANIMYLNVFSFQVSSGLSGVGVPCLWKTGSLEGIVVPSLWPVLMFVLLGVMFLFQRALLPRNAPEKHALLILRYLNASWRLLLFCFTVIVMAGFKFMNCEPIEGISLLREFHNVECFTTAHTTVVVLSAITIVALCLGVPVAVTAVHFAALGSDLRNLTGMSRLLGSLLLKCGCHKYARSVSVRRASILQRAIAHISPQLGPDDGVKFRHTSDDSSEVVPCGTTGAADNPGANKITVIPAETRRTSNPAQLMNPADAECNGPAVENDCAAGRPKLPRADETCGSHDTIPSVSQTGVRKSLGLSLLRIGSSGSESVGAETGGDPAASHDEAQVRSASQAQSQDVVQSLAQSQSLEQTLVTAPTPTPATESALATETETTLGTTPALVPATTPDRAQIREPGLAQTQAQMHSYAHAKSVQESCGSSPLAAESEENRGHACDASRPSSLCRAEVPRGSDDRFPSASEHEAFVMSIHAPHMDRRKQTHPSTCQDPDEGQSSSMSCPKASSDEPKVPPLLGTQPSTPAKPRHMSMIHVVQSVGRHGVLKEYGEEFGAWILRKYRVWYEAFFLMRRVAVVLVFVFTEGVFQKSFLFLLSLVLFVVQVKLQPYKVKEMNTLGDVCIGSIAAIAGLELAFSKADASSAALDDPGVLILGLLMLPGFCMVYFLAKVYFYLGHGPAWLQRCVEPIAERTWKRSSHKIVPTAAIASAGLPADSNSRITLRQGTQQ